MPLFDKHFVNLRMNISANLLNFDENGRKQIKLIA